MTDTWQTSRAWETRPPTPVDAATSAAELFRLPPHRSGTHCQKTFRHQLCCRSSTTWKHSYLNCLFLSSTLPAVSQCYLGHSWLIERCCRVSTSLLGYEPDRFYQIGLDCVSCQWQKWTAIVHAQWPRRRLDCNKLWTTFLRCVCTTGMDRTGFLKTPGTFNRWSRLNPDSRVICSCTVTDIDNMTVTLTLTRCLRQFAPV